MLKLDQRAISKILTNYHLGDLIECEQLKRNATLQPCFIIKTTEGKFFLKQYNKFNYNIKEGLELIKYLEQNKYPSVKVILNSKNKPYTSQDKSYVAIFEFIDLSMNKSITNKEAYELGKSLGRFHTISKNFAIKRRGQNYEFFSKLLQENYYLKNRAQVRIQKVVEYLKEVFPKLRVRSDQPQSTTHGEFTVEHVRFENEKLVKVIDWDNITRDYMINDLGTTATGAFVNGKLNFELLANIIQGYNDERKLTSWEKAHLFEALFFGSSKFFLWGFCKEDIEAEGWPFGGIEFIEWIMKYEKEEFNRNLNKFLQT